ncbi:MAG: nucleotidyltransferase domain-containing protein [Fimbriimonadales bacterium]|nr:nucleotidyltransferase domain-containing protein [Fimbriimonadales bacterium]MDW8051705.1 nucleotidyltransferase domain-containing protein [Armatimonadota bacterium]
MSVRGKYAHLPPLPSDIARRLAQLPKLMARASVQVAYLFGSACDNPEGSADIDLAVVPARGYSYERLYSRLSLALGTGRGEVIELPAAPLWLQREVLRRGRRIYARDSVWASRYEVGLLALIEETQARWRAYAPALVRGEPMEVDREFLQQVIVQLR